MKLINPERVSHLVVFNETEGVWSTWGYWAKLLYVPYKKHKWWEFEEATEEGFYEEGIKSSFGMYRSKEIILNSKKWFIKGNSVWTFPFIQIFCGKDVIHTEYFATFTDLEKHIKDNYSNCTVEYN
jgi:hypothetical protein